MADELPAHIADWIARAVGPGAPIFSYRSRVRLR